MMGTREDIEAGFDEPGVPVWAVFGDLMAGLLGAFVLILVCALGMQMELASKLETEVKQRQAEAKRLQTLEQALAGIQPENGLGIGSNHPRGIIYLSADGAARVLDRDIDPEELRRMLTVGPDDPSVEFAP